MPDQVPEPDVRTRPSKYPLVETGSTVGAIAVYLASGPSEHKIEISPTGDRRGRTHNVVRLLKGGPVPRYVAVFPGLSVGLYTVWQGATKLAGTVMVRAGEVTEVLLPAGRGTDESGGTLAPSLLPAAGMTAARGG
jgi:hypothetical protein